jgi:addiction module RelE/StbE family toxin
MFDAISYIKVHLKNNAAAEKLKLEIKNVKNLLKKFPLSNPIIENVFHYRDVRFILVENYIIFYTVKDKNIIALRFLHRSQNWSNLLKLQ